MNKKCCIALTVAAALLLAACGKDMESGLQENPLPSVEQETASTANQDIETEDDSMKGNNHATKALGAMKPEEALEYMKNNSDLVIVDVATTRWFNENHFDGAIHIPIEELSSEEKDALYLEIPAGRPVLMHCRLGMVVPGAYARVLELRQDIPEIAYIDGRPPFDKFNEWKSNQEQGQKLLGGISPEDALEYMKNTTGLVIVEVNAPEWKLRTGISGAMWIPYTEMAERNAEIPEGHPVLIHCGGGIVSVEAYEILQEKRPDIPELSYIAGAPPVKAYNEWLAGQK